MDMLSTQFKRRNVQEQLEPLLEKINVTWGQYRRHKDEVTRELAQEKLVIIPFSEKFMRMPYEWQAHRATQLLHSLDEKNQIMIIPAGSKLFRKSPSKSTLKKGNLLPVRYHPSERLDLRAAFIKQLKTVTQDKFYYGWDFAGVQDSAKEFRTILLYDHIRAQLVHEKLQDTGDMVVQPLCDYRPDNGLLIIKKMPSFVEDKIYDDFIIEGAMLQEEVAKHPSKTFDIAATHSCYKTVYAKTKFGRDYTSITGALLEGARQGRETTIDHHVILALHIAQKELAKQHLHLYNPFIAANQTTIHYFNKLHKNVLLDYKDATTLLRKPLDIAHIETLLWSHIAYENRATAKKNA